MNMCSRRSGKKKGCPCRDDNISCSDDCKCGKVVNKSIVAPCKNRKKTAKDKERNITPSGHDLMEKEIETAKVDIKKIIEPLSREILEQVVVEIAAVGAGSADLINNIVKTITNDDGGSPDEPTTLAPDWCCCKVCIEMPTETENKCCRKKICLSSYQKFTKLVLDKDVLDISIMARADLRSDEIQFDNAAYRKAAYYQYILWQYGKLGRGNRRVVPSCIVNMIRNCYPDPNNVYMGFKWN